MTAASKPRGNEGVVRTADAPSDAFLSSTVIPLTKSRAVHRRGDVPSCRAQAIIRETIDGTTSEVGEEVVMWVEEQFIDSIKDAFAKSVMMS